MTTPLHRRPELDTENPPGQIVNYPLRKLSDYIADVLREETKQDDCNTPDVLDKERKI